MKYFIKTFGCQQNVADSERIEAAFRARGMTKARSYKTADYIIINTCMVRQSAENRVYGLVNNLAKFKSRPERRDVRRPRSRRIKIIVTGCMVGLALRDKTGKYLKRLREKMPFVDEFMPIEEVGFDYPQLRQDKVSAWVPISNGCNNFCAYCVVPFSRGCEVSRPFADIIKECQQLKLKGYQTVTLLGQNVNSYGADIILNRKKAAGGASEEKRKPVYVKHLGRYRIPTLFSYLLERVAKMGFEKVDFISSNPWDFSDELIDVIARNNNITRTIHLPIQSGDDNVLKRMNRWYKRDEYLNLVANLKLKIKNLKLTTDIIVGFCGETEKEFKNTVNLCRKVNFEKAYVSIYSPRPMTAATKVFNDNVPFLIKKKRWQIIENLINQPHFSNANKR